VAPVEWFHIPRGDGRWEGEKPLRPTGTPPRQGGEFNEIMEEIRDP